GYKRPPPRKRRESAENPAFDSPRPSPSSRYGQSEITGSQTVLPSARSSLRLGAPVLCAALGVLALFTGPDRPAGGTASPAPPPERLLYDEAAGEFRSALRRDARGLDARKGQKYAGAAQTFRDAPREEPGDTEAMGLLEQVV